MNNLGNAPIELNAQDKQVARMGSYIVWLEQMLATADRHIGELRKQAAQTEIPDETKQS